MKSKITILCLFIIGLSLVACGPTKQDAIKYSDEITTQQRKVVDTENKLTRAIKDGQLTNLDGMLKDLSTHIDSATATVKNMKDFDGKSALKDAVLALFTTYRDVADHEYKAWLRNLKTPADSVNDKVLSEEQMLVDNINKKLDKASDEFKMAQTFFAAEYKFELSKY